MQGRENNGGHGKARVMEKNLCGGRRRHDGREKWRKKGGRRRWLFVERRKREREGGGVGRGMQ